MDTSTLNLDLLRDAMADVLTRHDLEWTYDDGFSCRMVGCDWTCEGSPGFNAGKEFTKHQAEQLIQLLARVAR